MNCVKQTLLVFVVSIFFGLPSSTLHALEATPTPDDYWLKTVPLQISAYKFSTDGSLVYLEVYNNSEELLDLAQWNIQADFTVKSTTDNYTATRALVIANFSPGVMTPKSHSIIASVDTDGMSYSASGWGPLLGTGSMTVSATVTVSKIGYKSEVYSLKTLNDNILYRRTKITTGYASSSTAFAASNQGTLYDDGLYALPAAPPSLRLVEVFAYSSECAPEDISTLCGDYLKFQITGQLNNIEDYVVRTDNNSPSRTSTNTFALENANEDGEYLTIRYDDDGKSLSLTNSGGYVWIEDKYQAVRYGESTPYPSFTSSNQGWGYALAEEGLWGWTTTPKPGGPNVITAPIEEVTTCPTGKYLNPDTGRCRTLEEAVNALAACPEGQERNPATNRCRAKVTTTSTSLTPCGEGQERNPATNRCRSIASAVAELMPCDEGYERNPATNRCKKVAGATSGMSDTNQLIESAKGTTWDAWTWSLAAVAAAGAVGYGVYEWRSEIGKGWHWVATKLGKK